MGLLSAIFSTKENVSKGMDAVIKTGDAIWYTEEEQAADRAGFREWFLKYLETTNPQNLARRVIAFMVVGMWTFLILLSAMVYPWNPEWSGFVIDIIKDVTVSGTVAGIMAFYYWTHNQRAKK